MASFEQWLARKLNITLEEFEKKGKGSKTRLRRQFRAQEAQTNLKKAQRRLDVAKRRMDAADKDDTQSISSEEENDEMEEKEEIAKDEGAQKIQQGLHQVVSMRKHDIPIYPIFRAC